MSSQLRVDNILPSAGTALGIGTASGSITFNSNISGDVIFNDDVTVNGVLTYEDVTNIDSVGVITARSDISIADKIVHTGDTDTAIRFPGADQVSIETGGTQRLLIGSDGKLVHSTSAAETVDFGTSNSSGSYHKYDLGSSGATVGYIGAGSQIVSGSNVADFGIRGQANLVFSSGGDTERLRITSAGRIGINNTSPSAMLQVDYDEGNSEVGLRLRAYNASGSKTWQLSEVNGNAGVFSIRNQTNSTEGLEIHADGHLRVPSGDLRVGDNTDSNAGTKTISVGSVSSGSGGIGIFANPTNGNSWVQFGDGTSGSDQYRGYMNYQHADDSLRFGTAGSERFRIDSSGRLLLNSGTDVRIELGTTGSTGTNNRNHLRGDGANMKYNCCSGGGHFFEANGGERMRISSNGHVNIGDGYIVSNSGLHVGRSSGGTAAGESIIAATMGNDSTMVSALLTVKNAGNRGAQGASGGSPLAKFEFNNGTAFEIDKYGRRTLQYQPACKISIDSNNQGGGNSAQTGNTIVPFNSTAYGYNIGNHFNTTNHIFTCPLAGRYLVLLSLNVIGDNIVYIYKNGTVNMGGEYRSNPTGVWEHCELSGVIDCSANDTIKAHSYLISSSGGRKFNGGNGGSYWDTLSIYYLG